MNNSGLFKTIIEIVSKGELDKQIIELNIDNIILRINILEPIVILYTPIPSYDKFVKLSGMCENIKFGIITLNFNNFNVNKFFKEVSITTPISSDQWTIIVYNKGSPTAKLFNLELEDMKQAIDMIRKKYNF